MPHYRFNLHLENHVLRDRDGQHVSGPDTAWELAGALARELIQTSVVQPASWANCFLKVTDEADRVVIDYPFARALEHRVA
jgi:malonyl CoA-acyl carrier protein transacylase